MTLHVLSPFSRDIYETAYKAYLDQMESVRNKYESKLAQDANTNVLDRMKTEQLEHFQRLRKIRYDLLERENKLKYFTAPRDAEIPEYS